MRKLEITAIALVSFSLLNISTFFSSFNPHNPDKIPETTNIKAFLKVIRYAEGTAGEDGYRTMFTGRKFTDLSKHPNQINCSGNLCSSAAGAYQYLFPTWQTVAKQIGATDFSPANQDKGAIYLLKEKGAIPLIENGQFEEAVILASPIWASFPNQQGNSVYPGQNARALSDLKSIYLASGGQLKNNKKPILLTRKIGIGNR